MPYNAEVEQAHAVRLAGVDELPEGYGSSPRPFLVFSRDPDCFSRVDRAIRYLDHIRRQVLAFCQESGRSAGSEAADDAAHTRRIKWPARPETMMAHYRFRPRADAHATAVDDARYHALALFDSDDFRVELLRSMVSKQDQGIARSAAKPMLAQMVADRAARDHAVALQLALEYARQSKTFLAVLHGTRMEQTRATAAQRFILEHGRGEDCYGPLEDPERNCFYYLFTRSFRQQKVDADGESIDRYCVRWCCVAEVRADLVVLHWDNFNWRSPDDDDEETFRRQNDSQFPYWSHLPGIKHELGELLGCKFESMQLLRVVLHTIWDKYETDQRYEWTHERIRAENRGVALTASGTRNGTVELDAAGVEALTRELAQVALTTARADKDLLPLVAHKMLNTIIRKWGPKSYQFRLTEHGGEGRQLFRGHAYFGTGKFTSGESLGPRSGPDSFPHVKCFVGSGGSALARDFLLKHLGS